MQTRDGSFLAASPFVIYFYGIGCLDTPQSFQGQILMEERTPSHPRLTWFFREEKVLQDNLSFKALPRRARTPAWADRQTQAKLVNGSSSMVSG